VPADEADVSGLTADGSLSVRIGTDITSDTLRDEIESLADTTLPDGSTAAVYLEAPMQSLPGRTRRRRRSDWSPSGRPRTRGQRRHWNRVTSAAIACLS
jgi:hypothetical protein